MKTGKRKPSFDARQQVMMFDVPVAAARDGQLEGLDRRVASAVSHILSDCARAGLSRYQIASGVSELLQDDVTKLMLDAYSSEARDTHNISVARFLALVSETGSFGVLNSLLSEIGARVIVGEEISTVELGHVQAQLRDLKQREAQLLKIVKPISHKGGK